MSKILGVSLGTGVGVPVVTGADVLDGIALEFIVGVLGVSNIENGVAKAADCVGGVEGTESNMASGLDGGDGCGGEYDGFGED